MDDAENQLEDEKLGEVLEQVAHEAARSGRTDEHVELKIELNKLSRCHLLINS